MLAMKVIDYISASLRTKPQFLMHPNEQIITDLYEAFSRKDYRSMQRLYHDDAIFNDEVFKDLNAREVKAMWEMLIKRGKDLEVEYNNIQADETGGTAEWTAVYSFSKKKRPQRIDAGR